MFGRVSTTLSISAVSVIYLGLLLLCQEADATAQGGARVDAELDPYETVIIAAADGSPKSDLFSSCLEESRTVEVKLYSIEATGGKEFVRYVPDDFMKSYNVVWTDVSEASITSIVDCADAAADSHAFMFKYQEGDCQVAFTSYDPTITPSCEDAETEAVFILKDDETCYLPKFKITTASSSSVVCAAIFPADGVQIKDISHVECYALAGVLYYPQESEPNIVSRADLGQYLTALGISTDLVTGASWQSNQDLSSANWNYNGEINVLASEMVDGVLPADIGPQDTNGFLVMRADENFLFEQVEGTEVVEHVLCIPNY